MMIIIINITLQVSIFDGNFLVFLSLPRLIPARLIKVLGRCCFLKVLTHATIMVIDLCIMEFPLDLLLPNHGF
jgi:hypothetical protein